MDLEFTIEEREFRDGRAHGSEGLRRGLQANLRGSRSNDRHKHERFLSHDGRVGVGCQRGEDGADKVLRGGKRGGGRKRRRPRRQK